MHPKKILDQLKITPSKKLGQNFLIHESDAERIAKLCHPETKLCHPEAKLCHPEAKLCHPEAKPKDLPQKHPNRFHGKMPIVEIGPGLGIVSKFLSAETDELILIEKDKRLSEYIAGVFAGDPSARVRILCMDFLRYSFENRKHIIVGNIPYNIASLILLKLVAGKKNIEKSILMLPIEMSQKILAQSGKLYGVLSLTMQLDFEMRKEFRLQAHRFYPKPDVDSVVLTLVPKKDALTSGQKEIFYGIIKKAFQSRRKMLRRTFGSQLPFFIDPTSRPQDLSLEDYVRWSKAIQ